MKTCKLCGMLMVFAVADALAQAQPSSPADPTKDPAPQGSDASQRNPAADPSVNMGRNPHPSTQQTEGTTKSHGAPTAAPAPDASLTGPSDMGGPPQSSTGASESAAVASDHAKSPSAPTQTQVAPEPAIAGTEVVTASDQPLGSVVETVFDAQGQPAFVVISAGKDMTVLPYQTARAMMNGQKIVIDRTRLTKAPKVKPGEWKDEAGASEWKNQATQYWDRG